MQDLEHIAQSASYCIRDADGEHCGLSANEVYNRQIISYPHCTIEKYAPTFSERMIPWRSSITWIVIALILASIFHHLICKAWYTYQYEAETERIEMEKNYELRSKVSTDVTE